MKTIDINKKEFIDWFFSDIEDLRSMGNIMYQDLHREGKSLTTLQDLYKMTGYIPTYFISNTEVLDNEERELEQIEEPSAFYKARFI